MRIVIGDNQVRVKDCYAPAPDINLTLRSNGEEPVMVMDSLGQFVRAGIEAPTAAPLTAVVVIAAPGFAQPTWLCYRYVYAATQRYPLVENAVTAGGNQSPRSNSSPSATVNITVANRGVDVTVTKTQRLDITKIWVYRTDFFTTQAEAEQASEEGLLFYVGEVTNDGVPGTVVFHDTILTVTGNELMETDNFLSEQFWLCLYVPPYFYGFANLPFTAPISVTAAGIVTLTNPWSTTNRTGDKWFEGRNAQVVTMEGITTGGFDGYGSYYFKWLTSTTAQLCLDLQLLQNGPVNYTGTTNITIKGPAANLYRSKPNNPFSWGEVVIINEIAVPQPWVRRVGGGQGTAMTVVPVLNLLKLDTEGPNKTYTYNLKAQGTDEFDLTKQEISSDYSVSNHWSQFPAKTANGDSLVWFLDNKFCVVCESDGANNRDVSSAVYESVRGLSTNASDRLFSHGCYDPRTQLSLVWVTTQGPVGTFGEFALPIRNLTINNTTLAYHHPTNTWSLLDYKGVLCSAPYLDRDTNQQMTLIGTESGRIGKMFEPEVTAVAPYGRYANWIIAPHLWPKRGQMLDPALPNRLTIETTDLAIEGQVKGMWMWFLYDYHGTEQPDIQVNYSIMGCARILSYTYPGSGGAATTDVFFDRFRRWPDNAEGAADIGFPLFIKPATTSNASYYLCFLESQLCNCCKVINVRKPIESTTFNEMWVTRMDLGAMDDPPFSYFEWSSSFTMSIQSNYPYPSASNLYTFKLQRENGDGIPTNNWFKQTPIPIDSAKVYAVSLYDVGYGPALFTAITPVLRQ